MKESADQDKKTREVDIVALALSLLKEWKTLFKFCFVFGVLGIAIALSVKKTYTANVILAPETSSGSSKLGNLSSLASTFGANLGSLGSLGGSDDAITPLIYPNLFASMDFLIPLREIKVMERDCDTVMTYERHVFGEDAGKEPLIARIKKSILGKKKQTDETKRLRYNLTVEEENMYKYLSKNIGCLTDKKTDIVTICVKDNDPLVAAIVADTIQNRLQEYIIAYRTKKARTDLEYYEMLLNSARAEYEQARNEYAAFAESHQGVVLTSYKLTESFLEDEMEQKYSVMTQMQMQVQASLAKLQEATPAFAVIQSSYAPLKASSMSRTQMVILSGFLGFVIGAIWIIIGRSLFLKLRHKE